MNPRDRIELNKKYFGFVFQQYHLLDSLIVFADTGDEISLAPANRLSLTIDGPFAAGLGAGPDNLVLRAAQALQEITGTRGATVNYAVVATNDFGSSPRSQTVSVSFPLLTPFEIGLDTPSIDHGPSTHFGSHVTLFQHGVPAFENVANLDRLPAKGFTVIALPMKIRGGSGGPLRIVAMLGK